MDCILCCQPFNLSRHLPLILCREAHTSCAQCALSLDNCPFCRTHSPLEKRPNLALRDLLQAAQDGDLCPKIPSDQVELHEKIDEGGFAAVYAAEWFKLPVAVKLISLTEEGRINLQKEMNLLLQLNHPAVLRVYGLSYWEDRIGIVMERASSSLPCPNSFSFITVEYAKQLCQGVSYLHSKSIVHGDLKPGNVLVVDNRIRIADFGTSRNIALTSTVPRSNAMTLAYAAPEQFDNKVTPQSDIYSLGIVLYELFHNRHAFEGMSIFGVMGTKQKGLSLPFDKSIPTELANIVKRCLAVDSALRPRIIEIIQILQNLNLAEPKPIQKYLNLEKTVQKEKQSTEQTITRLLNEISFLNNRLHSSSNESPSFNFNSSSSSTTVNSAIQFRTRTVAPNPGRTVVNPFAVIKSKTCHHFSTCQSHQRDSSHDLSFTHAPACHHESLCKDQTPDHRESFWHRPICEKGLKCSDADCLKFKHHDHLSCPNPNCVDLTVLHQADVTHPIHLADDPFNSSCSDKIVCPRGFQCTEMTTKSHMEKFVHLERKPCPNGTSCKSVDEIHLNTFSHSGVLDFRPPCSRGASCKNRGDLDHVRMFSHRNIRLFEIFGNLMPDLGVFTCENKLDYVSNQRRLHGLLPKFPTPKKLKALGELLMRFRPVHRIKPETFESCLTHGAFYSLNMMKTKLADPAKVRQIVAASHYQLVNYSNQEQAADFLAVSTEMEMNGLLNKSMTCPDGMRVLMECTDLSKEERSELGRLAKNIAQAALDLNNLVGAPDESGAKVGIGFQADKDLRGDRTVFSILGPNTNTHYGPIAVIFKSSVTKHTSTFLHVTAATKYYTHDGAVPHRPYIRIPADETEKKNNYYSLVQNFGVKGAAETVALDMCHSLNHMKEHSKLNLSKFNISSVTEEIFVQSILMPDNHFTIECHLPSKISFSDVEHVVMPRTVYTTLSNRAQHDLEVLSRGKENFLILTESVDSCDYLNNMIEASYCAHEQLEYGFNILLTPQEHHRWAYLMSSCSYERELCIKFDVNSTGSFIFGLVNGECPITFGFNNGYVSVYESANPNPGTPTLATLRMYFVKRMADKYIRFGIKINKATGEICIERIDHGLEFQFDKISIISKNLRNSRTSTSQIKVQLESGSSSSYASFTHIELNTSKERITPRKVWACPVDKKSGDVIHPKGKKCTLDKVKGFFGIRRQVCQNPFTCKHYYDGSLSANPKTVAHMRQFIHVCRFGKHCKDTAAVHRTHFVHLNLLTCPHDLSCTKLDDPVHRFNYYHEKIPFLFLTSVLIVTTA
ncbi:hypothetical protein GEMRC1_012584 [Eukaryota sp. GEM-RC1]